MVFSQEDLILIKVLHLEKGYGSHKIIKEFPEKGWKRVSVEYVLTKLHQTGTVDRKPGSGRPRSGRTDENIAAVDDLAQSQEDAQKSHKSSRQISRQTDLSQSTVCRIIHEDLGLKCLKRRQAQLLSEANRTARLTRSKQLLRKYPSYGVDFIWFTDEKVFTVQPPMNR